MYTVNTDESYANVFVVVVCLLDVCGRPVVYRANVSTHDLGE